MASWERLDVNQPDLSLENEPNKVLAYAQAQEGDRPSSDPSFFHHQSATFPFDTTSHPSYRDFSGPYPPTIVPSTFFTAEPFIADSSTFTAVGYEQNYVPVLDSSFEDAPFSQDFNSAELPSPSLNLSYAHGLSISQDIDAPPSVSQQQDLTEGDQNIQKRRPRSYCVDCQHDYKTVGNYNKHRRDKHEKVRYACSAEGCGRKFTRNSYRRTHEKRFHPARVVGGQSSASRVVDEGL